MHTLDQLLSRVVERRGFAVQGADAEALFAKKGEESLLTAWKTDGPVSAADAAMFLAAYEQVHASTGILVATQGVDASAKDALAAAKGVEVWAESRLIHEVGEAPVADATEIAHAPAAAPQPSALSPPPSAPARLPQTPSAFQATQSVQDTNRPTSKFPSLVAQAASASVVSNAGAAYYMPNKKKEQPADMQATIGVQKGGSLGYAWGGSAQGGASNAGIAQIRNGRHPSRQVDQWGNLVQPGQQPSHELIPPCQSLATAGAAGPAMMPSQQQHARGAPATPVQNADSDAYEIITTPKKGAGVAAASGPAPATNTLKLNITREEAMAKVGAKAGAIVKLALVPHVAFEYDVNLERPDLPQPVTGKGAILVSSLTGELRNVEKLDWSATEITDASRKDQEKLQAVDVYEKVKNQLLKTYSRSIQVEKEIAGNTVMGTVKIVPDPEEMGMQHRGMVYVPVWEITGGGANAKVDAFSGATL